MNPDIGPLLLVVLLAVLAAVWSAALWFKAWLLDRRRTAGRHRAVRVGTYRGAWQAQQPVGAR